MWRNGRKPPEVTRTTLGRKWDLGVSLTRGSENFERAALPAVTTRPELATKRFAPFGELTTGSETPPASALLRLPSDPERLGDPLPLPGPC